MAEVVAEGGKGLQGPAFDKDGVMFAVSQEDGSVLHAEDGTWLRRRRLVRRLRTRWACCLRGFLLFFSESVFVLWCRCREEIVYVCAVASTVHVLVGVGCGLYVQQCVGG